MTNEELGQAVLNLHGALIDLDRTVDELARRVKLLEEARLAAIHPIVDFTPGQWKTITG